MWVLNGRISPTVGEVRTKVKDRGGGPGPDDSCVIFIHGANKDESEALAQARTLEALLLRRRDPRFARSRFCAYLWPATRTHKTLFSGAGYPARIDRAERAGRALGRHIRSQNWGTTLLIGHSLRARVAIDAAR